MSEQDPDLEGLHFFANSGDRELSPIFVGREREIEHVRMRAERVGKAHAEGRPTQGATTVITGCPGAGKSAFLGHFARKYPDPEIGGRVLIPVKCTHHDLTAPNPKALQTLLAELVIKTMEWLRWRLDAVTDDQEKRNIESQLRRLERTTREEADKRTVVCLLVDEIQTVTEASARTMQMLHTRAFSPPVLPVYAGLDDSVDRLETVCGIARLAANARMTMGAMRAQSAREATAELFEKYRIRSDPATRERWAEAIEAEACDFAQHLHLALQGACSIAMARGGTARAEDADEVKRRAREAREQFYRTKMVGIVRDHAEAVLDVVHQATGTNTRVTKVHLAAWARAAMNKHSPRLREHTDEEALKLIERTRRQGILHLSGQGHAEVSMPSLHEWLTGPYAEWIGWQPPASHGTTNAG